MDFIFGIDVVKNKKIFGYVPHPQKNTEIGRIRASQRMEKHLNVLEQRIEGAGICQKLEPSGWKHLSVLRDMNYDHIYIFHDKYLLRI